MRECNLTAGLKLKEKWETNMLRVIFAPKSKEMLVQILIFANVLAAI